MAYPTGSSEMSGSGTWFSLVGRARASESAVNLGAVRRQRCEPGASRSALAEALVRGVTPVGVDR